MTPQFSQHPPTNPPSDITPAFTALSTAPRSATAPPHSPRGSPLRLELPESGGVVARPRPRGPESPPSNRYAGDWSVCHHQFLLVPGAAGEAEDNGDGREAARRPQGRGTLVVAGFALGEEQDGAFGPRPPPKDRDSLLLLELERELAQQIDVCL